MSIHDKRTEIKLGADTFFVQQFPPFEGLRVMGELQKIILPALGGAAVGTSNSNNFLEGLSGGLMLLAENLDGDKLEQLSKMLLRPDYIAVDVGSTGDRKNYRRLDESTIDTLFTGRYLDLVILMIKVAEVNFLDFRKLCGIPAGFAQGIDEIKSIFRANFAESLREKQLSTAQSTEES